MRVIKTAIILVISLLTLASCERMLGTPIKRIVENSRDYDGKTVTVSGEVKDVFSLFIIRYFIVEDSTGEIAVITPRPLPKKGTRISVTGKVSAAFSIGQTQTVVILEEEKPK